MIKYIYQLFVCSICVSISSCSIDNIFDVKSDKSLVTPSTLEDLQAMLDNPKVFNYYSPMVNEIAADNVIFAPENLSLMDDVERIAYTWTKDRPFVNVPEWRTGLGSGGYGRVYYSNLILETLDKIDRSSDSRKYDDIKGQALFQRAYSYFELSQVFCPFLDNNTASTKFGLPLKLDSDINGDVGRSTVGETYALIERDLKEASELMPNLPQYKTRGSKCAAYAILARFYLIIGKYQEARKYANAALDIWDKLISYKELDYTVSTNPFVGYVEEVIFYSRSPTRSASDFSRLHVEKSLFEMYDDNDLRKKVFFNYISGTVFYKGGYSSRDYNTFFSGLATDELYLVRAECNARLDDATASIRDVNILLKSRWLGEYKDIGVSNSEEALIVVLEEREKELIFRGVRWSDLRRLNKDPRFVQTITRNVDGKIFTLEPNSYKYTFPLPDEVIEFTGMQQNPGW